MEGYSFIRLPRGLFSGEYAISGEVKTAASGEVETDASGKVETAVQEESKAPTNNTYVNKNNINNTYVSSLPFYPVSEEERREVNRTHIKDNISYVS